MYQFPKDKSKIRARIRRYERELRKEEELHSSIHDGGGKRYLLGSLYMLLGDNDEALKSFGWFEKTFPDDIGEPFQYLCWTLALYRAGDKEAAKDKLIQTMLRNLYLLPHLLGINQERLDTWHSSNWDEKEYAESAAPEIFELWADEEKDWVRKAYSRQEVEEIRSRYIEIHRQLKTEPVGAKRTELVMEASRMERLDKDGKFTIEGDDGEEHPVFKHDEAVERYMRNPDSVIADFTGHRFIFKVVSGYITDDGIVDVEEAIRDTATDYEYPFHGMDVTGDRIEVKIEVSVNEAPLESAKRFQKRLDRLGVAIELVYIGTLGKEQSN